MMPPLKPLFIKKQSEGYFYYWEGEKITHGPYPTEDAAFDAAISINEPKDDDEEILKLVVLKMSKNMSKKMNAKLLMAAVGGLVAPEIMTNDQKFKTPVHRTPLLPLTIAEQDQMFMLSGREKKEFVKKMREKYFPKNEKVFQADKAHLIVDGKEVAGIKFLHCQINNDGGVDVQNTPFSKKETKPQWWEKAKMVRKQKQQGVK